MSDDAVDLYPYAISLPTGRVLGRGHVDRLPRGRVFNISRFPRATAARIAAARTNLPEIPDERIDRSVDPWVDRETGAGGRTRSRSSSTSPIPRPARLRS